MGKAYNRSVGYRSKKRKFYGKKCSKMGDDLVCKSASSKKLKTKLDLLSKPVATSNCDTMQGYRIIDIGIFFNELSKFLCCNVCHSKVTFLEDSVRGCSSIFTVKCMMCERNANINSSPMLGPKKNISALNIRIVYSMRCIGQGLSSLETFCAVMDMPPPITQKSYDCIVRKIKCATQVVAENSMKAAAIEEASIVENSDLCVSGDGTWKTRGHTSKIGVCSIIGAESGKVIDVEVLSSFCKSCEKSVCATDHDCKKNHTGSSGVMEVIGMKRIFERSEVNRKVRYLQYIGDGDTKTFLELSKAQPYGDLQIEKLECIGHVQKRMGTRLRKVKEKMRGVKLSDGKVLGGKGRLTDKLIDKLSVYYGSAIRSNTHCLRSMREAVWATYCHMCSTDEEPMHMFCPKGVDSWCRFQKHVASDREEDIFHHIPSVPIAVMKAVKSIYAELAEPNLLRRCLSGKTQNPNESFNSVVWKFCPKTSGCGRTVAEAAVYEAVIAFNDGNCGRLDSMRGLGITPGIYATTAAMKADAQRIKTAEKRADVRTLEARRRKRMSVKQKNERLQQKEGITYKSGGF